MTQNGCNKALAIVVTRLRAACRKAGMLSIRDVARKSGVSKSGIDRIWKQEHFPTLDTLLAICNAADVYLQDILTDHDGWRLQQELEDESGSGGGAEGDSKPAQGDKTDEGEPQHYGDEQEQSETSSEAPTGDIEIPEMETSSEKLESTGATTSIMDILKGMKPV